jgi:hypothetical protein
LFACNARELKYKLVFSSIGNRRRWQKLRRNQAIGENSRAGQGLAYHAPGREQDSDAALAGLIAEYSNQGAHQITQVYAYRGQSQEWFTWLERAYTQREPGRPEINSDPLFRNLHDDPRYAELLQQMHLPI